MRVRRLTAMLCLLCLALNGCATVGEVENQAYALILGVDRDGGGIELTIRIPRIGQSGDAGAESGSEAYLVIAARGDGYAQALEHLQWAAARELNLSQLKLVIVSEALSSEAAFPALISEIAETRHLYTTAGVVVCEGRARDFIEEQETILGTRLSSEITAMFRHYAEHGYISKSTFADLYSATRSFYSDPTAIWGFPDPDEAPQDAGDAEAAALLNSDTEALNDSTRTASSRGYLGSAVFRDGRLAARLDGAQTLCLNLITGSVGTFAFAHGGRAYALSSATGAKRSVSVRDGTVRIAVSVRLTAEEPMERSVREGLETDIAASLIELIRDCQRQRIEPFGFAERAALRFPTLRDWLAFDWRARFASAEVSADVSITGSDA